MATLTLGLEQKAVIAAKEAFDKAYVDTLLKGFPKEVAYTVAKEKGKLAYEEACK